MPLRAPDFESSASAIPPLRQLRFCQRAYYNYLFYHFKSKSAIKLEIMLNIVKNMEYPPL